MRRLADQDIRAEMIVQVNPEVAACALLDETALLHMESGVYFGLDPVASRIWEMVGSPIIVNDLSKQLMGEFEVSQNRCEEDLFPFLKELAEHGLITVSNGSAER